MKHGADWYRREPTAYLGGVQGMTSKEHAVYSVVLELIYQHGGSVNDDPAWISGWISDMGAASVRKAIQSLISRGKLVREGDQLTNIRAKSEAKTKENLRETREKAGRKGGEESGKSRADQSEIKDLSEAIGSPRLEKTREEKKEEDKKDRGRCSASAPEDDLDDLKNQPVKPLDEPTDRERILDAIGVSRDGVVGASKFIGGQSDMAEAERWLALPGLSLDAVCAEIRVVVAAKPDGPPSNFRYFTPAMRRLSAALTAPPLEPSPGQSGHFGHKREPPKSNVLSIIAELTAEARAKEAAK